MGSFAQFPLFLPKLWTLSCQKMVHFWQFCVDLSKNSKSVKAIYSFQGRQTDSAGANIKATLCISLSKPDWARKGRRCILSKSSHGILRILKTFHLIQDLKVSTRSPYTIKTKLSKRRILSTTNISGSGAGVFLWILRDF